MIGARRDAPEDAAILWDVAIDVALERQIGLNWCWAAIAKGIVEHYGGPRRKQCRYATTFLRQRRTCCGRAIPPPRCDAAHDLDTVLARYDVFAPPPVYRPVRLETLRRELDRDRPVVALFRFPSAVHAVAIRAVSVAGRRIGFADPWYGPQPAAMDAQAFAQAYERRGTWFYTILTRPRGRARTAPRVSLLRDRAPRHDVAARAAPVGDEAVEIDLYEADPAQLARGDGLRSAERASR